jgi:dephospho-CoA kinase
MKEILLLSGYARSGKDSVANLLEEEYGYRRFAFADALKEMVATQTGLSVDLFHSVQKDTAIPGFRSRKTYRDLLLETAVVERSRDLDVFSRIVAAAIETSDATKFVISDWRYKREESFLRGKLDPTLFHITRGRVVRSSIIPATVQIEHDLDGEPMDIMIMNNGSLADLKDSIYKAFHG